MIEPRRSAVALATAVVAAEMPRGDGARSRGGEEVIMTKLHASLGKLIGSNGFDVLLARALRLAQGAEPTLSSVRADSRGALTGFAHDPGETERGVVAILSHLIELLIRFIGEALAERIIGDIWPGVAKDIGGHEETKR